uniref:Uncharacterized protein n=1 Tax=Vespula pensylvanica TaxID=30213 RepID=A0A834JZF5_VESPE|nr:hypothetical protein H0235_016537 [Vespula pensylvanica]
MYRKRWTVKALRMDLQYNTVGNGTSTSLRMICVFIFWMLLYASGIYSLYFIVLSFFFFFFFFSLSFGSKKEKEVEVVEEEEEEEEGKDISWDQVSPLKACDGKEDKEKEEKKEEEDKDENEDEDEVEVENEDEKDEVEECSLRVDVTVSL